MKRCVLVAFLFINLVSSSFAQKLKVESFAISEGDLSAVTPARLDENDRNCALIKVGIALDGVLFEGNVMGNVIPKLGEYWVYMPQGNSMLRISHKDYTPIMINFYDYGIEKLESGKTYILTLAKPNNATGQKYSQKQTRMYNIIVESILKTTLFGGYPSPLKGLKAYVNKNGSSYEYVVDANKGSDFWLDNKGQYKIPIPAAVGDKLTIACLGYQTVTINVSDSENSTFYITMVPQTVQPRFEVIDSVTKLPLPGTLIYKNLKKYEPYKVRMPCNSEEYKRKIYDEEKETNSQGIAQFSSYSKIEDVFTIVYPKYKIWKGHLQGQSPCKIELVPYDDERIYNVVIRIRGVDEKNIFAVVNKQSGESKEIKRGESCALMVKLGDTIELTRRGYRTISLSFNNHINEDILVSPQKGKLSDKQVVEF